MLLNCQTSGLATNWFWGLDFNLFMFLNKYFHLTRHGQHADESSKQSKPLVSTQGHYCQKSFQVMLIICRLQKCASWIIYHLHQKSFFQLLRYSHENEALLLSDSPVCQSKASLIPHYISLFAIRSRQERWCSK